MVPSSFRVCILHNKNRLLLIFLDFESTNEESSKAVAEGQILLDELNNFGQSRIPTSPPATSKCLNEPTAGSLPKNQPQRETEAAGSPLKNANASPRKLLTNLPSVTKPLNRFQLQEVRRRRLFFIFSSKNIL